jgi:DNA-binding NarL/FixJ family response regulator
VAEIRLLRPIRVLVAGDDHIVVTTLAESLMRLGFDTLSTSRRHRVASLAASERVNVVILETSGGRRAAAALASSLDELPHRVRVLIGDSGRAAARLGYDVIDPDAPVQELAAAVHRAYRAGPARATRASRR